MRVLHIKLCKISLKQGGWGLFWLQSRILFLKAQNPLGQRQHFGPLPDSLPGCRGIPNQSMGECGHLPHDLPAIKHYFVSLPEPVLRGAFCLSQSAHSSVHKKEGNTNEGQRQEGANCNPYQHGGLGMLLHEMQPPGAQGGTQTVASLRADIFLFLHD